ncbi:MAG: hypothetical protein NTU89_01270 [Candidatus Dependentiae bacterium]|nr:hypothetical protein [Candidatus Dependentiae bacterium]
MIKKMLYVGMFLTSLTQVIIPKKAQRAVQPSSSSITGSLYKYDLTNSVSASSYDNHNLRLNHIATHGGKVFASAQSVSPDNVTNSSKVHSWNVGCSGEFSTFCHPAAGPITDIQAASGFVATLNSTCPAKADVWCSEGYKLSCIKNCEPITKMALNNYDCEKNLFLAYGKHFNRYAADGCFIETCPAAPGRVNAIATSKSSDYIFVANDENNKLECWNNATGVKVSSVCTDGAIIRLATQDDYVFVVSEGSCNQIQIFDFTCAYEPSHITTVTACGPIREMVVASGGYARVFVTHSNDLTKLEGWCLEDGCCGMEVNTISGFDPLTFCIDISHIAADENRVTVYGKNEDEDKMESYSVYCGDHESCFTIPKSTITHLATTHCGEAFAVFSNIPNKVQKFNSCGGHAQEFCESTCGDITKLYAGESLIAAVAHNNKKVTIYSACGDVQGTIESCEAITDVVITNDQYIYLAVGSTIKKYSSCGHHQCDFDGKAYSEITILATTDCSDYIYAATKDSTILVFESNSGQQVSKYYSNTPIKLMNALSDGVIAFVTTTCANMIRILNFQDLCNPAIYNSININDWTCGVVEKLAVSSHCGNRVFAVTNDNPHDVWGWRFAENCEWESVICTYNPLSEPSDVNFLVAGKERLFVGGDCFLRNYEYNDGDDISTSFNLHEQITHLASTRCDRVFASFQSDKDVIYHWCSEGGSSSAFCHKAHGPIEQLVATGKYVASLNECRTHVDIWRYNDSYKGSVESHCINDIAVNNRNTEDEDCEGSVYLAHGKHITLYSTDGDNETLLPQVSGVVTHIASADGKNLVYTTSHCNTKIEAFTRCGKFVSSIQACGQVTQMIAKGDFVFAVNESHPNKIEIFDFSCPQDPFRVDTVTTCGNIAQIAASQNGLQFYATNLRNLSEVQGWVINEGCCEPISDQETYNPFTIDTTLVNLLAADESVIAVIGEAILN